MRFTPLVGTKAWFGPRRFGWGFDPVSWEGWAVMAASLVVFFGGASVGGGFGAGVAFASVAALLATTVLKGTSPGGPTKKDRFLEHRRNAARTPADIEAARRRRQVAEDEPSVADAAERLRRNRA
jgi:hypothetical protein